MNEFRIGSEIITSYLKSIDILRQHENAFSQYETISKAITQHDSILKDALALRTNWDAISESVAQSRALTEYNAIQKSLRGVEAIQSAMKKMEMLGSYDAVRRSLSISSAPSFPKSLVDLEMFGKLQKDFSIGSSLLEQIRKANALHESFVVAATRDPLRITIQDWNFPEQHRAPQPSIALRAIEETVRFLPGRHRISQQFTGTVASALEKTSTESRPEAVAEILAKPVSMKAHDLKPDILSYVALLDMILAILIFFIDRHERHLSTEEIKQCILGVQDNLHREIQQVRPEAIEGYFAFIRRDTYIKSVPSSNAPRVARAYKGQLLRIVAYKHRWVQVEYFDYLIGEPRTGWVLKKHTEGRVLMPRVYE